MSRQGGAQRGRGFVSIHVGVFANLHFDEFVVKQGLLDGGELPIAQAVFANLRNRRERMSQRAKVPALLSSQRHGALILRAAARHNGRTANKTRGSETIGALSSDL